MVASQGGALPRPSMPMRRVAAWGDGVPAAMALSPDGASLYVATALRLRKHDAGELSTVGWDKPLATAPTALALSPDGSLLAVALGSDVELRDPASGELLASLRQNSPVADLAFAPRGSTLAVALAGETLALWDAAAREPLGELRIPDSDPLALPGPLTSVAFAPDGLQVAAGDLNGNVAIWSVEGGAPLVTVNVGLRVVAALAYAPDGGTIAAASEGWRSEPGGVWLFDTATGAEAGRLTIESDTRILEPIEQVAFSPEGTAVLAGTSAGKVLRWSWPEGALLDELAAHRAAVSALALTAGGGLITAGRDGDLRRWNSDGARIDELDGMPAISAVAAGEESVATGGEDGSIVIWGTDGSIHERLAAHRGHVNALASSPDGAFLASGGDDGTVRIWSMEGGAAGEKLRGHEGPVLALAFAPDGQLLASAGWDGTIQIWSVPDGARVRTIEAIESDGLSATAVLGVAFDADGQTVAATAYDGAVRRFRVRGGPPLEHLETGAGGWLIALAGAPLGLTAALDDAGLLWAWDADGQPAGRGALADATALAPLADGRLLTVGPAGGLRLWALDGDGLAELATAASVGDRVAAPAEGRLAVVGSRRGFVEVWKIP